MVCNESQDGRFGCGYIQDAYACTTRDFECLTKFECSVSGGEFECGEGYYFGCVANVVFFDRQPPWC